ncbi:LuxR C-terminal-related transcriptional regulator [Streptomyces sp. NPDC090075]|uniref:helix-turn-helix transcriptional regulator n=1 Tax=Streptomyces sp. NPDC090075 TaxID=3365937 RepID=UPI0038302AFC
MRFTDELIGRHDEVRSLQVLLNDLAEGRGSTVIIEGPPGTGCTRLAREAMFRAGGLCTVAWTRAADARDAYRMVESLTGQLRGIGWSDSVPPRPADGPDTDPAAWRGLLVPTLRAAALARPVALFVDDVHLADLSTTMTMEGLLELTSELPLLLVMTTAREQDGQASEPRAWQCWNARPRVRRILLRRLPDEAVARMLRASLPTEDEQLVDRITRAARGNPRLAQSMALWSVYGGDSLMVDLAADELVRHRVTACEQGGILAAVALFTRPVTVARVARATGHQEGVVSRILRRAETAGIISRTEPGPTGTSCSAAYELAHPLLGAAVLATLEKPQLNRARVDVARAIVDGKSFATTPWTPAEVASLLVAAGDRGDLTLELCLRAALACEKAELFGEAVRFASYALRHVHRGSDRVTMLRAMGRCLAQDRRLPGAALALEEAVATAALLPLPGQYAQSVMEYVWISAVSAGRRPGPAPLLRRALEQCPPGETMTEASLRALLAEASYDPGSGDHREFAESQALASEALRLVEESGATRSTKASVRFVAVGFHMTPHGWGTVRTVVDAIRAAGDARSRSLALPAATALCLATGGEADLAALEAECVTLITQAPNTEAVDAALSHVRAARALLAGQWDTLAPLLSRLRSHGMTRDPRIEAVTPQLFAEVWNTQDGRPSTLAADSLPPSQSLADLSLLWRVGVTVTDHSDDPSQAALRLAERTARMPPPPEDCTWSSRMFLRARLATVAGDTRLARATCAELTPFTDQFGVFSWCLPIGPVGWYIAEPLLMLGRVEEAMAANRRAESASRRLGAQVWTVRCLTQRARLFRIQDPSGAEAARAEALSMAEELNRLGLFLEAQRLTPSGSAGTPAPGLPLHLSAREREVLELIGQGLNNKEIAIRMGLSVGTVERHCSSMYRKLRVRNRVQALSVTGTRNQSSVSEPCLPAPTQPGGTRSV